MDTIKLNRDYLEGFISQEEIDKIGKEIATAKEMLIGGTGAGNDYLGWVDLPEETTREEIERIEKVSQKLIEQSEVVVVVGIGGSYLGARAVIESMGDGITPIGTTRGRSIMYAGHTLSEDYYYGLLNLLSDKEYSVIVISKSGTTTEPAVAFRIFKQHLETKYGKEGARGRIVAITDRFRGALHDIAEEERYERFVIPDNVGGRFSVLTPVGLLPIATAGYDIGQLLSGAAEMRRQCVTEGIEGDAARYAAIRNVLYRKGKKVEMLVNFMPSLCYFSEWWKQLYGESEGKAGKGLLPHSLSFTTDLHSMGQYVQEGERNMFETVLHVDQPHRRVEIPFDEKNTDGINYLVSKSLNDINHNAELGTIMAHNSGGVPVLRIDIPTIDERWIGQLIYFFEFACGISGYTLGVNPFDQPGVEAYKRNMFHLLGKPGF